MPLFLERVQFALALEFPKGSNVYIFSLFRQRMHKVSDQKYTDLCLPGFHHFVHLIPSLSISYPYLIEFHYFADNSQEGMKHQMRGATQAQEGMTLRVTLPSWK
jgi:hypothetical protein